jgi:hypothetical protein
MIPFDGVAARSSNSPGPVRDGRDDRASARRRELRDALALALVPVSVALALGLLLLPRQAAPDSVPLPTPNARELARTAAVDRDLAQGARRAPLPGPVRALGSALREYHLQEARGTQEHLLAQARHAIEAATGEALAADEDELLRLRASQLETFLTELRRFEATGVESEDLLAVAGTFVSAMRYEGWCTGTTIAAGDGALRAMFKEMWNGLAAVGDRPAFRPSLDEERALYALYLLRPHPARAARDAIASARRSAHDEASCAALAQAERAAAETWRIERIARLAAIDPAYPALYARGVANLRRGDYSHAADDLSAWLRDHPDGPFTLRARSALRAAVASLRIE